MVVPNEPVTWKEATKALETLLKYIIKKLVELAKWIYKKVLAQWNQTTSYAI